MKRVAIVAAHFPPSNLAGVHRARLWVQHLQEFGWRPIVVTTHWDYYEEPLDWDLHSLVDPSLEVIRTKALPVRPFRLVGDLGIRGFWWHYRALERLALAHSIDFIHITIPSNFSALLGRLIYERYGIPYGIDYIDPWVHSWPGTEAVISKAWCSYQLSKTLEPWAVRKASLITGVAPLYFQDVLDRNAILKTQVVTRAMPYGLSDRDFEQIRAKRQAPSLFNPDDGNFHIVYAGALLPKAHIVLDKLLDTLSFLRETRPALFAKLRLHFIGTGLSPADKMGHQIMPRAIERDLGANVSEHPHRMAYSEVLAHLSHAQGILILGSTEPHYTPSKVFQAVQARRPLFALLHEASSAHQTIADLGVGISIPINNGELPPTDFIAERMVELVAADWQSRISKLEFSEGFYSARHSAEVLASGLDEAWAKRSLLQPSA